MNSEFEYHNWFNLLSNLGSRIMPSSNKKSWMDLENFIVLGTRYATEDSRVFTSFIVICINLAPILSPFKIRKIAFKTLQEHEFNILGYVITKIQENVRNQAQWKSLISMCNKKKTTNKEILLFNAKAFKTDEELNKWNLTASKLELENHDKYANMKKLFKHYLINQRFSGIKTVYSDINFYRQIFSETSLHKMSKYIFHDYNTVYQANELLKLVA